MGFDDSGRLQPLGVGDRVAFEEKTCDLLGILQVSRETTRLINS